MIKSLYQIFFVAFSILAFQRHCSFKTQMSSLYERLTFNALKKFI